jgi:hypothetical protein
MPMGQNIAEELLPRVRSRSMQARWCQKATASEWGRGEPQSVERPRNFPRALDWSRAAFAGIGGAFTAKRTGEILFLASFHSFDQRIIGPLHPAVIKRLSGYAPRSQGNSPLLISG